MQKTSGEIRANLDRTTMQANKRQLTDTLSTASKDFCSNLRFMINMLYLKNKGNPDIEDIKRRLTLASGSNPMMILELAGPHIFKYRESLIARKTDFFLNKDYLDDVNDVKAVGKIEGDANSAKEVIDIIKKTWLSFKEAEQTVILNKAIEMLSQYAKYLMATKKLNELAQP